MLEQPFNSESQDATDEQRNFWKKSAIVRQLTVALGIMSLLIGVFTLFTTVPMVGRLLLMSGNLLLYVFGIIILLTTIAYFVFSYFCFKNFARLRRLGLPKKRMYIIIIICMGLSLIATIISWSIPIIELIYLVLAILSLVNISRIKKENA